MKKFTRENFEAFLAEQDDGDTDMNFVSSYDIASMAFNRFEEWLAKPEAVEDLVKLPAYAKHNVVLGADDKFVCKCHSAAVAQAVVEKMNEDYLPDDEDDPFQPDDEDENE